MEYEKYAEFDGSIVVLGCGSIGQGVLPLILRHVDLDPSQLSVFTADRVTATGHGIDVPYELGVDHVAVQSLTPDNYRDVLTPHLGRGDFLLNLSVDVESRALIELCRERGALYLDTCSEPWPGGYTDANLRMEERTNYALREDIRALRDLSGRLPTAVRCHGANPGLVSHFVKQALLDIAPSTLRPQGGFTMWNDWATLANGVGLKVIHIAERDTQASAIPKRPDEFVNTWSIDGFYSEGSQPSEMGWGTHEPRLPKGWSEHDMGCKAAVYRNQPGYATRVRTWTPLAGEFIGRQITHDESVSIADFLTLRDGNGKVTYRPTVHYAYHPCDAAVIGLEEWVASNGRLHERKRLIVDDILKGGIDELGVLLMGDFGAYWYGSRLSIDEARELVPHNNATSLQVTAPVLAGMIWAMENPNRGVVDPDEMDYERVLEIARPYLGPVVGVHSDWTPLQGRRPDDNSGFPHEVDLEHPWAYQNFSVS